MFDLKELLVVTTMPTEDNGPIVEACGDYYESLRDFFICVPDSSLPAIIEYIESLANNGYMLKLMRKSSVKGLQMLLANEHKESYTNEFIRLYGGIQELIDAVTGNTISETEEFTGDTDFSVVDSADNGDELEEITDDMPSDFVPSPEPQEEISADTEDSETDIEDSTSYNNVESNIAVSQPNLPANQLAQDDEMYLMIRGIAQVLGLTEFDDTKTLTIEDLQEAKKYINNLSSLSIREALLAVLDMINTKADLRVITRFLELFILYLKENNISR